MKKKLTSRAGSFILDIFVIFAGIAFALLIFSIIHNRQQNQEKANLIPNAKIALEQKQYGYAVTLLEQAQSTYPDDPEVYRLLAEIYFTKSNYDEALNYYQELETKTDYTDYDKKNIGQIYLEKSYNDSVLKYWEGLNIDPSQYFALAEIYYDKGDLEKNQSTLQKIIGYKEPLILTQVSESDLATISENLKKASTLQPVNIRETFDTDALIKLVEAAQIASEQEKFDYSELIQLTIFANTGQCKFIDQRITELQETLLQQEIPTYQVDFLKGKCLNQEYNPAEAIALIQAAIEADPTVIEYREELARSYFLQKDIDSLVQTYEEIFIISPAAQHYERLGLFLINLGETERGIQNYKLGLEIETNEAKRREIAFRIYQLSFQYNQNLDICSDEELKSAFTIPPQSSEEILVAGICEIRLTGRYTRHTSGFESEYAYLKAVKNKNTEEISKIIDKDTQNIITINYNDVGRGLVQGTNAE